MATLPVLSRAPSQTKGVPLFPCMDCSCVFKKLGSLNAHISKMHISMIEEPSSTSVRALCVNQSTEHKPRDFRWKMFYMAPTQMRFILPWRLTSKRNRPFYMPSPELDICLSSILGHDFALFIFIICRIKNRNIPSPAPISRNCRQLFLIFCLFFWRKMNVKTIPGIQNNLSNPCLHEKPT